MLNPKNQTKLFRVFMLIVTGLFVFVLFTGCSDEESPTEPVIVTGSRYLTIAGESSLSIMDLETSEFVDVELGLGSFSNWIIPDNDHLYVINSGSNDISVFSNLDSTFNFEELIDIGQERNLNPYSGTLLGDDYLLTTNNLQNTVTVLDKSNRAIAWEFLTGTAPSGIVEHFGTENAFVICSGYNYDDYSFGEGCVYYQNINGEILDSLVVGINAQFAAMDSDGFLHVVCTGNYFDVTGEVWVLSTDQMELVETIPFEGYPGRISLASWGTAYIAAGGWETEGVVLTYDWQTLSGGSEISVGLGASDIIVDEENESVFVTCFNDLELAEIKADTIYAVHDLEEPPNALSIWEIE